MQLPGIAQRVVSAVLRQLNQEQIEDAVACFTTDFRYKDLKGETQ